MTTFTMPILERDRFERWSPTKGSFTWEVTQDHRERAIKAYRSSLENLARQGGITWAMMFFIVCGAWGEEPRRDELMSREWLRQVSGFEVRTAWRS